MKRYYKYLWLLGLALIGANAVAFLHAWHFTHFSTEALARTARPEQLTALQKAGVLLTGITVPKPRNHGVPDFPYATVHLLSPNGRLEAWYGAVPHPRGTVALFHGFTSSKSQLLTEARYFRRLGYAVLLTDFAGNGGSQGRTCTVGHHEAADVAAVVRWLQRRPGPVIVYANSMGAVATLRAEAELGARPAANILECPYGSMLQTTRNRFQSMGVPAFPLAHLLVLWGGVQNGFWAFGLDATRYAGQVTTPTLLLWGTADPRVTRSETDAIYAALAGPKRRQDFSGSGHEPYWRQHPQLWEHTVATWSDELPQASSSHSR